MYKEFYGLTKKPFSKTPDPEFLYLSRQHKEALARLEYTVEERDLFILTGEIGTGKTTLSRMLIDTLDDDAYKVIMIINPTLSPTQFLRTVAKGLGLKSLPHSRLDIGEMINEKLFEYYENDILPVIIIDEAQLIPTKKTFDEIRLMTNFQLDTENLLSLILLAQPELNRRLKHPVYSAFLQRVGMRFHLKNLSYDEVIEYLTFRTNKSGREESLFSNSAVEVIYEYSGGIPRLINNIAANSLLNGFGKEEDPIMPETVLDVVEELQLTKPKRISVGGK